MEMPFSYRQGEGVHRVTTFFFLNEETQSQSSPCRAEPGRKQTCEFFSVLPTVAITEE